jgi:hypothetical protein
VTGGMAGDALKKGHFKISSDAFLVVFGEGRFELAWNGVPKHDVEELVVDDFLDTVSDALKEVVAIEDGSQLLADVEKQGERLILLERSSRWFCGCGSGRVTHRKTRGHDTRKLRMRIERRMMPL